MATPAKRRPANIALIDFDADGRWEVASAGYGDGVRALDTQDGHLLWSLDAPAPTCPRTAATNIDGRGGDELLYVAGSNWWRSPATGTPVGFCGRGKELLR